MSGGGCPGARRKARRAETFAVRQWLRLGVASAGMGAALFGFALMGPQAGVAAADSSDGTSASPDSSTGDSNTSTGTSDQRTTDTASKPSDGDVDTDDEQAEDLDGDDVDLDADDADDTDEDTSTGTDDIGDGDDGDDLDVDDDIEDHDESDVDGAAAIDEEVPEEVESDRASAAPALARAEVTDEPVATKAVAAEPILTSTDLVSGQSEWQKRVAKALDDWTASNEAWVDSLSVSEGTKAWLDWSFLSMRRAFFNQAPTVAPVQIDGVITGPVVGSLGGVDPDGDKLIYILTEAPKTGTVRFDADGTYTFTPGEGFNGVDTFGVAAIDIGFHMNLLHLLRPWGSGAATSLVNQSAIEFDFRFKGGIEQWTLARVLAFEDEAIRLVPYLRVRAPVTLSYEIWPFEDWEIDILASAVSPRISTDPGYWPTVVQNKLLTGEDSNGSAVDGEITWNWGWQWALGDPASSDEVDFATTLMHELMHTFGFISRIRGPGTNDLRTSWSVFDSFVVTGDGVKPINPDVTWNTDYDPNLLGQNGGMYFGGANAIAAYGGPVPLYTNDPWDGSGMSHLSDDVFGSTTHMMTAFTDDGAILRTLSPVEIGILRDLGYLVVPPSGQ
ncbi:MAG: hypothetical protein JHC75_30135 [Rhodococcus sp.]|nr:hypothetical protein [Rhodococcus sp. (in: high G+C Gram-positive bacteria)]